MSKKKRKRRNSDAVWLQIFALLCILFALYEIAYAVECSVVASHMDAYLENAYSGHCDDLSEYIVHHRRGKDVPWYLFDLDNGKTMGFPQKRLEKAGFDAERFELLEGEPMRFAYTKLPRIFHMWRVPVAIEYKGEELLPREGMEQLLRKETRQSLIVAGLWMIISVLSLFGPLLDWSFKLWDKHTNRKNRKRKQEKKERYYAKQQLNNEKMNTSKGDKK